MSAALRSTGTSPASRPSSGRCCSASARTCSTAAAGWWPTPTAPRRRCAGLVAFHVDFALSNPDVIRVQDQDFSNLAEDDQAEVRTLQRNYVELWVEVLAGLHAGTEAAELRMRAHATFGLINSTPHSVRSHGRRIAVKRARPLLESMALAALMAPAAPQD